MSTVNRYILGLSMALSLPSCTKSSMDKVVDNLVNTCRAVEKTNAPCGYRRGDLPEVAGQTNLTYSGMETADKKLQERTNCRLLVFQRKENRAIDYLVQRKSCDLAVINPHSDLFTDYQKIYPK